MEYLIMLGEFLASLSFEPVSFGLPEEGRRAIMELMAFLAGSLTSSGSFAQSWKLFWSQNKAADVKGFSAFAQFQVALGFMFWTVFALTTGSIIATVFDSLLVISFAYNTYVTWRYGTKA